MGKHEDQKKRNRERRKAILRTYLDQLGVLADGMMGDTPSKELVNEWRRASKTREAWKDDGKEPDLS